MLVTRHAAAPLGFAVLLPALACSACAETARFRGPATYVVSAADTPPLSGALDQSGLLCANMLASKVILSLGGGCVLYASPSPGGHGATIVSGQRCNLPLVEGAREVVVRSGSLIGDASRGVEVTIGASPEDAPGTYVAYHLSAGPPQMGGEGCDALLATAPSR